MSKVMLILSFLLAAEVSTQDSAIDRMVQRLSDNDPEIRKQAVKDLTKVGKDAVPALEKLLKEGDLDSQIQVKSVLNKIEWDLGTDSIKKYLSERSSNKDVQIEMIGTRTLATWLPNVRLIQTIVKLPNARVEDGDPASDRSVFAIERYGNSFSKIYVGGIYSPSSLAGVLKGYKVLGREQAMDLAGILSEISAAVTGEKPAAARLENKNGTWMLIGQEGENIAFKLDEKGSLIDIEVSTADETGKESEKERLEIEKLKLDILIQKKTLENLEKKEQPKVDPGLPKLIIFAYTGGGIAGKAEEVVVKDGTLTQRGPGNEKAPIYNIPEEDREELLKLASALVYSSTKRVYGERNADTFFSNYTVSLVGKREADFTWHKDGTKVSQELEKFDAKYREILSRSKPVKK